MPYSLLLGLHAVAGLAALVALPIPLAARKGGRLHVVSGKVFFAAMVTVGVTGLLIAALWSGWPEIARPRLDRLGPEAATAARTELRRFGMFFATIGVLTLDAVTQGRTAFWRDRRAARRLELPLGGLLVVSGVGLAFVAVMARSPLFAAFAAFALLSTRRPRAWSLDARDRADQVKQHLQAMLGGATAAITAFSALTLRRWFAEAGSMGAFNLAFWLVPVVLGVGATWWWTRQHGAE